MFVTVTGLLAPLVRSLSTTDHSPHWITVPTGCRLTHVASVDRTQLSLWLRPHSPSRPSLVTHIIWFAIHKSIKVNMSSRIKQTYYLNRYIQIITLTPLKNLLKKPQILKYRVNSFLRKSLSLKSTKLKNVLTCAVKKLVHNASAHKLR